MEGLTMDNFNRVQFPSLFLRQSQVSLPFGGEYSSATTHPVY
jgi:hypothetical protein